MRRVKAYLPAIVLVVWSAFAALGGDLQSTWLLLTAFATAVMVHELRERYRDE